MEAGVLAEVYARFERPLRELAQELAFLHSQGRFHVKGLPVGTASEYQGHILYVECYWPHREPPEYEFVAFGIELCHLKTSPRINAGIDWSCGQRAEEFEPEWFSNNDWPEATPEVLDRLSVRMPELFEAFRRAVARGKPTE
jgi:hypothetical protein